MQEGKRNHMCDIFQVGADNVTIAEVIGTSVRMVQRAGIRWNKGEDMATKPPGDPANKVQMDNFVESVRKQVEDPKKSINKLTAKMGVGLSTMWCLVHQDLGLSSFSRT